MKNNGLRIFIYDLYTYYGPFPLTNNTLGIFTSFVKAKLNNDTVDKFMEIMPITAKANEYCEIVYEGKLDSDTIIESYKDAMTGNIHDMFKGVSFEDAQKIAELSLEFKKFIDELLALMKEDPSEIKLTH